MTREIGGALIALGGVALGGILTFVDSALRGGRDHRLASLEVRRTTYAEMLSFAREAHRALTRLAQPARWPNEKGSTAFGYLAELRERVALVQIIAPPPLHEAADRVHDLLAAGWAHVNTAQTYDFDAFTAVYERLVDLCREDLGT